MRQDERPTLRVESKDDKRVIEKLLSRHGIDLSLVDIKESAPGDDSTGGVDTLLSGMKIAVSTSIDRSIGFVLDVDQFPKNRRHSVRTWLCNAGLALPEEIPEGGFVGDSSSYKARVGV